ncbi:MAG: DUF2339 domain-containing protein, partial [Ferruginibacter sp.]
MEVLPVLLMIVLIIIILNQNSKFSKHLQKLEDELKLLRRQLLNFTGTEKKVPETPVKEAPKPVEETKPYSSLFVIAEDQTPVIDPSAKDAELKTAAENLPEPAEPEPATRITTVIIAETVEVPKQAKQKAPPPTFFERQPDMEKFIGENLVSKIGIAILVLAIGYFVKYAIDQNWIGPVARVAIGILCGGILIALAHRFRNSYRGFSSVLAGGGIAVFYFTITLAFQQFQLFSQTTAFVIMIVITIFAVALALLYDKQELAIIALVGGFLAPLLVSTGDGNYKVLFTYLVILNSGLLVIAYNKAWRLLNLLSFIFTVLMFGSWLFSLNYDEQDITYRNGFLFATVFYLLFLVINIAHNIKEKKKFIASDFGILLVNTSLYFAAGIYCLNNMEAREFRGLFSASMGVFNLCISWFLFRKQKVDTNILYLLIGITLTFISITAPIQLSGNYITMFWASEAVLLYWLFTKSRIRIIQYSSALVWVLMLISLLMDWAQLYGPFSNDSLPIIANRGFITTVFSALATYMLFLLRGREDETIKAISSAAIPGKKTFRIFAIAILFAAGAFEINHQFDAYYPETNLNMLYLLLYTVAFINILISVTQKIRQLQLDWYSMAIMLIACIFFYMACIAPTFHVQAQMITEHKNGIHFTAHWATAVLIAMVLYRFMKLLQKNNTVGTDSFDFITWIFCAVTVVFLSVEMHLIANNIFYAANNPLENIQRIYIKTGLPILWGLCSFTFMWLGMHFKYRTLRIISLSLFTLTLLKLFIFDIRNIPAGGKIAAFFCLGVLLLVVSFMYQRLKKIIIDN